MLEFKFIIIFIPNILFKILLNFGQIFEIIQKKLTLKQI